MSVALDERAERLSHIILDFFKIYNRRFVFADFILLIGEPFMRNVYRFCRHKIRRRKHFSLDFVFFVVVVENIQTI